MRLFRRFALLFVLTLLTVPLSHAGVGAVVYRGTFPVNWFWWNDYEITNIAFTSSDPQFYVDGWCNGNWPPGPTPEWKLLSYHDLFYTGSDKENAWIKGPLFTRVYGNFGPLDLDGSFLNDAWVCDVFQGRVGQLLAEGISEFKWNDHNTCNVGPGQNTWDQRALGNLYTPPEVCPGGMAKFDFTFHYMLTNDAVIADCFVPNPAHIRKVVIRGPDLKCIGK